MYVVFLGLENTSYDDAIMMRNPFIFTPYYIRFYLIFPSLRMVCMLCSRVIASMPYDDMSVSHKVGV